MDLKTRIADELADEPRPARSSCSSRSTPTPCARQHSPLMSPLVWDLAHIGNYEDQWLLRALGDAGRRAPQHDDIYDAFRHPRQDRPGLALLEPGRRPPLPRRRPRAGPSTASTASTSTSTRRTRCSPAASSTAWSCSTSTSTTRPCWPRST